MIRRTLSRFIDTYLKYSLTSFVISLVVFVVSLHFGLKLTINSNQLDMLPDHLSQVKAVRQITEMTGGIGFLVVVFKHNKPDEGDKLIERARRLSLLGKDKEVADLVARANRHYAKHQKENERDALALKKAADDLSARITGLPEIQYARHKFSLDFVTTHVLYRIETKDLKEAFRRISIKREELVRKADPLYIDLDPKPPYELNLTDLYKKYSRIGKKEVVDDYYVSPDRRMLVLLIKPRFDYSDIARSTALNQKVADAVADLKLAERGVKVEYTGAYAQYAYAYRTLRESLYTTGLLAIVLIFLLLFFFVRKKLLIGAMLISLFYALVLTFGATYLIYGELNLVTSMMGGILAGLGIDFGIHFVSRFREEFSKNTDLRAAMRDSILSTGSAAIWSASTTAAAFIALMVSEFQGFSEFGVLSALGIVITAIVMFFFTPLQILIAVELFPRFLDYLKDSPVNDAEDEARLARWNFPVISRYVLTVGLILTLPALWFARGASFDYDSRNMLEADAPAETLAEEMNIRLEIAGNPLAVAVPTIEEAYALWEHFEPLPENYSRYVVNVISLFSFVPPYDQQLENYKLIQRFKQQSAIVKRGMIPGPYQKYWQQAMDILNARPYSEEKLPDYIAEQFKAVPASKVKGYLTFIYPDVTKLHLAQDIIALKDMLSRLEFPMVGHRTIRMLVYDVPSFERRTGRRISGGSARRKVAGMSLSEREINGALAVANSASPADLERLAIPPAIRDIIIKNRPYKNIEDLQKVKATAVTTGSTVLVALFAEIVLRESRQILLYTAVLVLLILYLSFRRIDHTLVSLIPLVVGLALTFAVMALLDVKLNFFNTAVLPVIVGYGINNGIFIFRRFLEGGDLTAQVFRTGTAVVGSSLTTLAGWGSLAVASHPGLRSMGYVACIGLTATMLTAVIILPAVLELYARRTRNAAPEAGNVQSTN